MSATGSGFPASTQITFSVGGVGLTGSTCSTDTSGDFPGTTGTTCKFAVPSLPPGNTTVVASSPWKVNATINASTWPTDLAYDAKRGELFVGEYNSAQVTVLNTSTNKVGTSIAVGNSPLAIAQDVAKGEVFVVNSGGDTVSVINESTVMVTSSISVGNRPVGIAYDPAKGELFVTNSFGNDVSVINDTNLSVVATITVQDRPQGLSFDAALNELFVANAYGNCGANTCGTVSVINAATNTVVANVSVGNNPYTTSYDSVLREIFVPDYASDAVSVISTSDNSVVATISLPSGSQPGDTYFDALLGETLVTDTGTSAVSVLADGSNAVVGSLGSQSGANNLLYAPDLKAYFVTDSSADTVSRLSSTTASTAFTVLATKILPPSVSLRPVNGTPGSSVSASGTGLQPDSPVSLTFAGVGVQSNCRTNASGDFPGTTGTACTFTVPSVPAGPEPVVASSSWQLNATISAGPWPTDFGYDAQRGELFVGEYDGNDVTVVNATTNQVTGTIPVGASPLAIAVDEAKGFAFVANSASNNVSVINETTNKVTSVIPVAFRPVGIALDPAKGELFVSESAGDVVIVINDTTLKVVTGIPVQDRPQGIGFDPALGELFVANAYSNTVSVISDRTDSVVANVTVGSNPYTASYDSVLGEMFVPNDASSTVSVISTSNNSVVATIALPSGSGPVDTYFDPLLGQTLVTDSGTSAVSVLADGSNAVIGSVVGQSGANNLVYAPNLHAFFVSDSPSNAVSRLATITAGANFTIRPILDGPPSAEIGSSMAIYGAGFGASVKVTTLTLGGVSAACISASEGNCTGGTITTSSLGSFLASVRVPNLGAAGTYPLVARDLLADQASINIALIPGIVVGKPVATPASITIGNAVTFTVKVSNGTGTYPSFLWAGLPVGCNSTNAPTLTCTPNASGRYSVTVTVSDTDGGIATSPALAFFVSPLYTVTFEETGLPKGLAWGVVLGSQTQTAASGSNVTFQAGNGNHSYVVLEPAGYVTNNSGTLLVNGSDRTITLRFHQVTYAVDFIVIGLPTGANWSVTVVNSTVGFNETRSSIGNAILFFLPNGTYVVTFHLPSGYSGNYSSTQITVAGKATGATLSATHASPSGAFWASPYFYLLVIGIAVAAGAATAVVVRRRPPGSSYPTIGPPGGIMGSEGAETGAEGPPPPSEASPSEAAESSESQRQRVSRADDPLAEVF